MKNKHLHKSEISYVYGWHPSEFMQIGMLSIPRDYLKFIKTLAKSQRRKEKNLKCNSFVAWRLCEN